MTINNMFVSLVLDAAGRFIYGTARDTVPLKQVFNTFWLK
jgi:hypothetical protein